MCNKCVCQVLCTHCTCLIFQVMRNAVIEFEDVIKTMFGHATSRHEAVDSGDTLMKKVRTAKQFMECSVAPQVHRACLIILVDVLILNHQKNEKLKIHMPVLV